ncbi:MAG TPA: 1-acyl-sn-glycerol-3-phosphate acyltransferase, partial [Salinisphaeraceae bacterium]|nr:1-acyl-sn-glycerol-3-phosphate acyltransferase [Salinisphaeraceae bacterium]
MHLLKKFLINLYGIYAAVTVAICVLLTTLLLLPTPGLKRRRRIARRGLRIMFFCAGMPFKVVGLERLPDKTSIAIINHRSYLDGLVVIAALPTRFTPVVKAEVSHIPVISTVLRRVGARYVQREPAMRAGRDTKHLLDALRAGESLVVFPEGTFSVDEGLLPFRGGASFLAAKAAVPIVPIAIQGTRSVLPLDRVLPCPARVTVEVLAALHSDGGGREAARALRDRTEQALWQGLRPQAAQRAGQDSDYAYYCDVFQGLPLPQAYVDVDLLEDNIRTLLAQSGGKKLRLDAHALRCPAVIDRVLRSNIRFQGVKCATAYEAVYLAREWELDDLLVAYPTLQGAAIEHVCAAIADGCSITMTADTPAHLRCLAAAAERADIILPVCMEVDLSAARNSRRSPLRNSDDLLALLAVLDEHPHLQFRGVLAFDTQRARRQPQRLSARAQRRLHKRRRSVAERLAAAGYTPELFNGDGGGAADGGTGIEANAADHAISEITVGATLFASPTSRSNAARPPAAGFVAAVMRRPA